MKKVRPSLLLTFLLSAVAALTFRESILAAYENLTTPQPAEGLHPFPELIFNGFDVSNSTIPAREIRSGGPLRDGIPSIDHPAFLPAKNVTFPNPDDLVIGFSTNGVDRAYPLRILVWHEIVNDTVAGVPIAVTYCPLCGTAMIFNRSNAGRTLTFGVSGLLYQSDVLMFDRETESLWSQLKMESVSGPFAGSPLEWLPSTHQTWAAWKEAHPDGEVLSTDTGKSRDYSQQPYEGYEESESTIFPVPRYREELGTKEWVIGTIVNGQSTAYPVKLLETEAAIEDTVAGIDLIVSYDMVARRPAVVERSSGKFVPSVLSYWFAWQAFYPETNLWAPQPSEDLR